MAANYQAGGKAYCDLASAIGPMKIKEALDKVGVSPGMVLTVAHPVAEGARPRGQA